MTSRTIVINSNSLSQIQLKSYALINDVEFNGSAKIDTDLTIKLNVSLQISCQ